MEGGSLSETYNLLCIDPGTTHLAAAVLQGTSETDIKMVWSHVYNCGHTVDGIAGAARKMYTETKSFEPDLALIEFQAPIGPGYACRWNAYVEGAIAASLQTLGLQVVTIQPSVAKRALGVSTGNYTLNKQVALAYARKHCPTIKSHHVADCYLLARYYFKAFI